MKRNILFSAVLAFALVFTSCEPEIEDNPTLGNPPSENQLSFTITQDVNDPFQYVFENTSQATGLVPYWEIGGSRKTGNTVTHRFPLPGEYIVALTISNRGGAATISEVMETVETDWDFLASPEMVLLSGGLDAVGGKSWVLDSLAKGHLGVGPAGSVGLEYWSADPLAKASVRVLYDDVISFNIIDFQFGYINNGKSYVKDFRIGDAAYSNPEQRDTDYKVDFTPAAANWNLEKEGDDWYLVLIPSVGPIFPIFDVGATSNRYKVLTLEENKLELVATGSDGNAWHYKFIPEGYVLPVASFEINLTQGTGINEYVIALDDLFVPVGAAFRKFTVDFGNGVVKESVDRTAFLSNVYMRKSPYNVVVTIFTTIGEFVRNTTIDVIDNHPDYEEFLINDMILYNNFSDVVLTPMGADAGAQIAIVDNPARFYPNRTTLAMHYSKTDSEWANAFLLLPPGYRFDIRYITTFRMMVYGKAGQTILLKLENTDMGGNAWQTGSELIYVIQSDDAWEIATFDFKGNAAANAPDVTADSRFNNNYYNVIRIMCNPGVGAGTHDFYFDELAGPHVEGLKSGR